MVKRVISGGQVGADIAALRAAKELGLETGGYCPAGWTTKTGPNPELGSLYGLEEHASSLYPPRTFANVRESDATVRFAMNFMSSGERCTLKAILQYDRPFYDVALKLGPDNRIILVAAYRHPTHFRRWLERQHVETLNVAGNALPDIEPFVESYLRAALA